MEFSKKYGKLMEQLGFKKNEIQFYFALLEMGRARVRDIAQKAGIHRVNAYATLESLLKKGLVTQEFLAKGSHSRLITPVKPTHLIELARDAQKKATRLHWGFEDALPELEALCNIEGFRPKVKFFEGIEGMKAVYEDTLKEGKEIMAFTGWEELERVKSFREYMEVYPKERAQRGIGIRILCKPSDISAYWETRKKEELREQRYLPEEYQIGTEINIYGDKIGILSFKQEQIGIIIESKEIAYTLRMAFELIWATAPSQASGVQRTGTRRKK